MFERIGQQKGRSEMKGARQPIPSLLNKKTIPAFHGIVIKQNRGTKYMTIP